MDNTSNSVIKSSSSSAIIGLVTKQNSFKGARQDDIRFQTDSNRTESKCQ